MSSAAIITMAGIGVAAVIGEKVLNACGKADMAQLVSISGLAGLGITAVTIVVKLLKVCASL